MMPILISFPVLGVLTMVQSAIMSRVHLLHGTTDLVLLVLAAWALHERTQMAWHWAVIGGLMIGLASALPLGITLAGYLLITALALFLKRQAWKAPVLALFLVVFFGDSAHPFAFHCLSLIERRDIEPV